MHDLMIVCKCALFGVQNFRGRACLQRLPKGGRGLYTRIPWRAQLHLPKPALCFATLSWTGLKPNAKLFALLATQYRFSVWGSKGCCSGTNHMLSWIYQCPKFLVCHALRESTFLAWRTVLICVLGLGKRFEWMLDSTSNKVTEWYQRWHLCDNRRENHARSWTVPSSSSTETCDTGWTRCDVCM